MNAVHGPDEQTNKHIQKLQFTFNLIETRNAF